MLYAFLWCLFEDDVYLELEKNSLKCEKSLALYANFNVKNKKMPV